MEHTLQMCMQEGEAPRLLIAVPSLLLHFIQVTKQEVCTTTFIVSSSKYNNNPLKETYYTLHKSKSRRINYISVMGNVNIFFSFNESLKGHQRFQISSCLLYWNEVIIAAVNVKIWTWPDKS